MAKKVTFKGFDPESHPAPHFYRGPSGEWDRRVFDTKDPNKVAKTVDVTKEVDDKEAERLLADFPSVFVAAGK